MLSAKKIYSWIVSLYRQLTLFHACLLAVQLYAAAVFSFASPFILRQLFLPSLAEYTAPLHFNFETCRYQLAGVCSFPTAVLDFSADNLVLSPGIYYEVSVEVVLSESTVNSNVGIFQAVLDAVDELNNTKTFRRSCFATKQHGLIYSIYEFCWNLACKTIFYPIYFIGLLSVADDRKIYILFTDRLVDQDIAKTVLFYVQLQNRFVEAESGKLLLRARFGLLRIFLYDFPFISSLLIVGFTYLVCLTGIAFYWTVQVLLGYFKLTRPVDGSPVVTESELSLPRQEVQKSVLESGVTSSSAPFIRDDSDGNFIYRRFRSKKEQ